MSEETKKAPAIRFQGFTDDWEQRKLGDVYTERNKRGNDSLKILSVSIHHGVSNEELDSNTLGKEVRRSEDKSLYKHVYLGDLVLNMMRAWQGAVGVVKSEAMVSPAYITAVPSAELYPLFMDFYLRRDEAIGQMNNLSYGVTDFRKRLYWDSFVKVLCHIPTVAEQEKITVFFTHLDDTIALHQRKLTLFNQLKETYLKQMFPQNEENMPVLRFADFSEPWEQRKLGDTVQITMGQSPNGENYTDNPRDHILVQGNADMKNGRVCPRVWTTQVTKKADPEDIILSVRAPVGDVGRTDYTVVLGRGVAGIKGNAFIFQTLSRMKEQGFWTRYSSGSTFESINSADLKDAFIQICHIEEQTKIGDFFTKLDDTIALHQSKLQKLAELKKTLLAKMLV